MNITSYQALAVVVIGPAIPAALVDLRSFRDARSKDPNAKFDWTLASTNWVIGILTGVGIAIGVNVVQ